MTIYRHKSDFDWQDIPVLAYKEDGTHFRAINRRVLFKGSDNLKAELRYFEIGPGGYSTLERHEHTHLVMVQRGKGAVLVGSEIYEVNSLDILEIPSQTWHQFQTISEEPLGFLCLVNLDRDRPHRPDPDELAQLQSIPGVGEFIRV